MPETRFDVLAIGNAIVDVLAPCDDAFIAAEALDKGGMALIDTARATQLYDRMGPAREVSGGSAANTCAGLAALGSRAAFIGQVADDQLGEVFAHDIRAAGVHFDVAARAGDPPTARCLILVTADGQRTMNTFLGASQHLESVDADLIASAKVLYLEGYLWDPDAPRAAMRGAIDAARAAGREIAFSLSDAFLLGRHGDDFRQLIADGLIDILFANEAELLGLTGEATFEDGLAALAPQVPVLVATRGEAGAVALRGSERAEVAAEPVAQVVDTTGAGDSFAAGFLHGHVNGASLADCLTMGAIAAGEIIGHYGARPEADLRALVAQRLG